MGITSAMRKYSKILYCIIFFVLTLIVFYQRGYSMEQYDFTNIRLPTYAKSSCSPALPRDFRGLKITMPLKINISEKERVPFCGAFQVSSKVDEKSGGKLTENTVLVFVNKGTNETFSFNLVPDKEPIKQEQSSLPQPTGTVVEEYTVRMYFNIDALHFFPDFPKKTAEYIVYATVLDIKSNVIETKIIY